MVKKQEVLDLTTKEPLIDRQRRLWAKAEAIELAQKRRKPLRKDVSEWLHRALKNIACGMDANEAFNVVPEKRGVRKNGFLCEIQQKFANGYIAASTEVSTDGSKPKKTLQAIKDGHVAGTVVQQPYEFGYQSVKMMSALLKGEKPEIPANKQIIVPTKVIKQTDVDTFWAELKKLTGKN